MKKIIYNKKIQLLIVITVLFISFLILNKNKKGLSKIENYIKDKLYLITNVITPKIVIDNSKYENIINLNYEQEIDNLNSLLDLNNSSTYSLVNAKVINRNINTYFNRITIDKGTKDGIKKDMVVINNEGLVGLINDASENFSDVLLITSKSDEINIPVKIYNNDNSYNGILNNYDYENNLFSVLAIRSTSKIENNFKVETNGLGGKIPSFLDVGEVVEVTFDKNEINKIVKVKPYVDYDNLKYVSVIINDN